MNPNDRAAWSIGTTKRELFAAMAMQGMAAKYGLLEDGLLKGDRTEWTLIAEQCVKYADALIAELSK